MSCPVHEVAERQQGCCRPVAPPPTTLEHSLAWIQRLERKNGKFSYNVAYRDPSRRERMKTFSKRKDAEVYRAAIEHQTDQGTYVDSAAGKATLGEFWEHFIRTSLLPAESTRFLYRRQARLYRSTATLQGPTVPATEHSAQPRVGADRATTRLLTRRAPHAWNRPRAPGRAQQRSHRWAGRALYVGQASQSPFAPEVLTSPSGPALTS